MTFPEFLSASTGAWVVGTSACDCLPNLLHLFQRQDVHHLIGVTTPAQQFCHQAHWVVYVIEEQLVSGAQVVQPRLAIRRVDEAVARAFPITGEQHFALAAVLGQGVEFVLAEFTLLFGRDQIDHMVLLDVPQEKGRLNEVIAGI